MRSYTIRFTQPIYCSIAGQGTRREVTYGCSHVVSTLTQCLLATPSLLKTMLLFTLLRRLHPSMLKQERTKFRNNGARTIPCVARRTCMPSEMAQSFKLAMSKGLILVSENHVAFQFMRCWDNDHKQNYKSHKRLGGI
ncbi:hypothetical protein EVAR_22514_1 [Eumeta japonica]|uniref:Uncharacterized protein n=1 Tax=Eumeta variegata TaxID=151549 RepID=A0A4C1U7G8_EUMVA|nr:hypothetical protein EVAR_22514_1 [Eumeta japonica]